MEGRMTICNMSIEWGAKAGLIAPDQTTFDYIEGKPEAPEGAEWDAAVAHWRTLVTDEDATFDKEIVLDASEVTPFVTWGTNPGQGVPLGASGPGAGGLRRRVRPGGRAEGLGVHGSRGRHPDARDQGRHRLRRARAPTAASRTCGSRPRSSRGTRSPTTPGCSSCPARCGCGCRPRPRGSTRSSSRRAAEWRGAGCSMCLGMNPDQLAPGERSASTSNRNFEGRQGKGGRTHLVLRAGRRGHRRRRPPGQPRPTWPPPAEPAPDRGPEGSRHDGSVHHAHRHRAAVAAQQRRHRPDHPGGLPQARHPHRLRGRSLRRLAQRPRLRPQPSRVRRGLASSWPARTSAPGRPASTPSGRSWTTASRSCISSRFADIFRGNSGKAGLLAAQVDQDVVEQLWSSSRPTPRRR